MALVIAVAQQKGGSGKSTVADALERRLYALGMHTFVLDGDNVRTGINKDLGFTPEDRAENVRRVAEAAKLMLEAGLVVIVALISPFRADRRAAREIFDDGDFIEVFVDTPVEMCATRDPKGLYKKAKAGEISNNSWSLAAAGIASTIVMSMCTTANPATTPSAPGPRTAAIGR